MWNQQKYWLNLLLETRCTNAKGANTSLEMTTKLEPQIGEKMEDSEYYKRIVSKLIYVTVTRSDIAFAVSVVSQFMQAPRESHWNAVLRSIQYLKQTKDCGTDWV